MNNEDKPELITRSMIVSALQDDAFFKLIPQFTMLKPKLKVMSIETGGCKTCRQKTSAANIMTDFLHILSILNTDSVEKLKKYFNVDRLMYNAHNPKTGAYETKII